MLVYMGLACMQGHGEAEAMCAYLNEDGIVDGCISQDSDCFLYGAKVVYRNFCTSAQGNRGGSGGAVDEYSLEKIERLLNLGRNKMIALALLCGCDYSDGLSGVGKEAALKLFKIVEDEDILERIKSWRTDNSLDQKDVELQNSNLCTSCGHSGKVQKHAKLGCVDCGTIVKCNDSYREKRTLILNEISLRKKALLLEDFPNQELIDEFLIRKDPVPKKVDLQWKQPEMNKLIDFMERHLSWEPQYAFEKIFPLVTRWQLLHLPNISLENRLSVPDLFVPEAIKKIRNIRSIASYEIIWQNEHDIIEKLKECMSLDKEHNDSNIDTLFELTSIEPQVLVVKCYPELVEMFENARSLKTKKRPTKKKTENVINEENVEKRKRRPRKCNKDPVNIGNNRKIHEFISKKPPLLLEQSFEEMSITPKRCKKGERQRETQGINNKIKRGPQFDKVLQLEKVNSKLNTTLDTMFNELSPDDFVSDNDDYDLNMTEVIDTICSEKRVFQFNSVPTNEINFNTNSTEDYNQFNTVANIETEPKECYKSIVTCDESDDEFAGISESYVPLNTNNIKDYNQSHTVANVKTEHKECHKSIVICDESDDEFAGISESYVPLNQRLLTCNNVDKIRETVTEINDRFSFGVDSLMNDTNLDNTQTAA
ncbi:XPG-like endonuclease isoform X2 [Nomia melanderi]|nr:flap endonuclease GEN isoform X2 [Nomia melanderi]